MRKRAVWKELPYGNLRAARKSRERDLNSAGEYKKSNYRGGISFPAEFRFRTVTAR